jgi:hypothetical protein
MKKRDQTVFVRNNGAEPFRDRYNSEDFEIAAGGIEEMVVECATLCLGFGETDKRRCLQRKGWANSDAHMKNGVERLSKFSFHMSENEALEHDPNKRPEETPAVDSAHSSAPVVGGDASGRDSSLPEAAVQQRRKSPLGKLADLVAG